MRGHASSAFSADGGRMKLETLAKDSECHRIVNKRARVKEDVGASLQEMGGWRWLFCAVAGKGHVLLEIWLCVALLPHVTLRPRLSLSTLFSYKAAVFRWKEDADINVDRSRISRTQPGGQTSKRPNRITTPPCQSNHFYSQWSPGRRQQIRPKTRSSKLTYVTGTDFEGIRITELTAVRKQAKV